MVLVSITLTRFLADLMFGNSFTPVFLNSQGAFYHIYELIASNFFDITALYYTIAMIYNNCMQKRDMPIGFYDSGVGGISVLRQTVNLLPHENFIYYGDNANAPYGSKKEDEIRELSLKCGDFLYDKGVKAIVIACNTATSIVVRLMREKYSIPVISMEPAAKPACEKYETGGIVVMATPATLRQKRYRELLERLDITERVINIECGGLAGLIEKGDIYSPKIKAYIYEKLAPLRGSGDISAIVIGCTHYSFVSGQIHDVALKILDGNCEIFDGMHGTARHIAGLLGQEGLLSDRSANGSVEFYSSLGGGYTAILREFFDIKNEI